jgi:hypothetical protein
MLGQLLQEREQANKLGGTMEAQVQQSKQEIDK